MNFHSLRAFHHVGTGRNDAVRAYNKTGSGSFFFRFDAARISLYAVSTHAGRLADFIAGTLFHRELIHILRTRLPVVTQSPTVSTDRGSGRRHVSRTWRRIWIERTSGRRHRSCRNARRRIWRSEAGNRACQISGRQRTCGAASSNRICNIAAGTRTLCEGDDRKDQDSHKRYPAACQKPNNQTIALLLVLRGGRSATRRRSLLISFITVGGVCIPRIVVVRSFLLRRLSSWSGGSGLRRWFRSGTGRRCSWLSRFFRWRWSRSRSRN